MPAPIVDPDRVAAALAGPGRELLLIIADLPRRAEFHGRHAIPVRQSPICPTCGQPRS